MCVLDSRQRNVNEVTQEFTDLKQKTLILSKSFSRLGFDKKSERCHHCGSFLEFRKSIVDMNNEEEDYKLCEANFCRERLCPMCAKRRSLKMFGQVSQIVEHIDIDKYDFIFLTLTVPNVSGDVLLQKISQMQKAFNKLIHYKRFRDAVAGYFRSLEITYNHRKNSKSYNTYHPHYHIILVVRKDYFTSSAYITRDEYLSMWQLAMNDYTISQVDVRKVVPKKDKKQRGVISVAGAVAEVAKYTLKPSDYLFAKNSALTDKVVSVLSSALRGRRLVAFGGIFADIRDLLGLDDVENGDLVHTDNQDTVSNGGYFLVRRWFWASSLHCYRLEEIVETVEEVQERQQKRLESLRRYYIECRKRRGAA